MSFICIIMKNRFHINGFAPSLALKVRFFETRKWPTLDAPVRLPEYLTSFCANLTASVVIKSLLSETGIRRFSPISKPEIQFYWELQKYGLLGQSPASGPEVVPGSWKNHPFTPFIAPIIFPSSFSPKSRENSVASMEIINSKVKARWEEWKCVSPPSCSAGFWICNRRLSSRCVC